MESRALGRTHLLVSRIGLGLAALGRPGYINLGHADDLRRNYDIEAMEAHAHAVLDAAWAAGIRYFDAARSYGRAEAFLSTWLASRRIPPQSLTVGSKWGYTYTAEWRVDARQHEVKDHSLPVLSRQLAESRELLGTYLALYQIHSATLESGVLDNPGLLEALGHLRAEGVHIGLTLSGARQADTLQRAMEVLVAGEPLFGSVQATWNLLEQSAGTALQTAHAAGMGVIIKEALANGRLSERNHDPAFAPQRRLLADVAARLETTVDALALSAVLAQPWVDVVLSGAATVAHLHSNRGALTVRWDAECTQQLEELAEDPLAYWTTRSRLPWN
jgi:aryl-alcohol dehydrogenase-like predicted oxidoreductase